eukprot:12915460-Alexandrium_andersonii.AAC.1
MELHVGLVLLGRPLHRPERRRGKAYISRSCQDLPFSIQVGITYRSAPSSERPRWMLAGRVAEAMMPVNDMGRRTSTTGDPVAL